MWRKRLVLLIVLLLALLGAGGGYWRTRAPDPVLRTINLGAQSSNFSFISSDLPEPKKPLIQIPIPCSSSRSAALA